LRPLGKQPYLGQVLEIRIVEDNRSSREGSLLQLSKYEFFRRWLITHVRDLFDSAV